MTTLKQTPVMARAAHMLRRPAAAAVFCGLLMAGCAGPHGEKQDFAFHPIDEIPQGAGLVTDDSGEFTVIKWDRAQQAASTETATASTPPPSSGGITEAPTPE